MSEGTIKKQVKRKFISKQQQDKIRIEETIAKLKLLKMKRELNNEKGV